MQKVRIALRGKAVVVMGKNTLIRKIMRDMIEGEKLTKLEALLPLVVGNMGFVFTNHNLPEIRKLILDNKVPAAAKSGSFAPADVYIPPGPTGLDPVRTQQPHGNRMDRGVDLTMLRWSTQRATATSSVLNRCLVVRCAVLFSPAV